MMGGYNFPLSRSSCRSPRLSYLKSLLTAVRQIRWRRVFLYLFLLWLAVSLITALTIQVYGTQDRAQPADVIIVLGAGLHRNNEPSLAQRARSSRGADLWLAGIAPYVICTGGYPGFATRSEAEVCADLVAEGGVPRDRIILEDHSRSTLENAFYSHEIMRARGWTSAVVVSDPYHLLRANWLFTSVGIETYTSPVDEGYLNPFEYLGRMVREVLALEWQVFVQVFNLPFTYVPLV